MKKLLIIAYACLLLAACGKPAVPTIAIKSDGKDIPFETKSGWATVQGALFSGSSATPAKAEHALRWITIRNFEFDAAKSNPNSDVLTAPEQVKIFLSLHDDAGTSVDTPVKVATYKGVKSGTAPMTFELINVYVFKDGKEQRLYLYPSTTTDPAACEVKITAVNGDTITGEINAAGKTDDGKDFSVKGPFTAKIYKR